MVISFTGAQSTGKSTLLEGCKKDGRFNGYTFQHEVTRWVKKKYDLTINEGGDDLTQLAILAKHLDNYLTYRGKDVVMDRCILDGLVYTTYLYAGPDQVVGDEVYNYAEFLFKKLIDKVDIIFYTEPEIPLVDDGERSANVEFRDGVVKLFEEAIDHFKIPVVRLKGTYDERMETIFKTLDNYGK